MMIVRVTKNVRAHWVNAPLSTIRVDRTHKYAIALGFVVSWGWAGYSHGRVT